MIKEATTTIVLQYSSNIRGIIVCGSCGDRTTATESKLSVRTVNIGASAFLKDPGVWIHVQYGHTPCLPIVNSMSIDKTTTIILLLFYSWIVSCGERRTATERERRAKRQRPKKTVHIWYNVVILNAFPLLTVDKKLSLEVTSKLERLEYSYKCCIGKEDTMV